VVNVSSRYVRATAVTRCNGSLVTWARHHGDCSPSDVTERTKRSARSRAPPTATGPSFRPFLSFSPLPPFVSHPSAHWPNLARLTTARRSHHTDLTTHKKTTRGSPQKNRHGTARPERPGGGATRAARAVARRSPAWRRRTRGEQPVSRRRQHQIRTEGLTSCNNKLLRFSVCTVNASGFTQTTKLRAVQTSTFQYSGGPNYHLRSR